MVMCPHGRAAEPVGTVLAELGVDTGWVPDGLYTCPPQCETAIRDNAVAIKRFTVSVRL